MRCGRRAQGRRLWAWRGACRPRAGSGRLHVFFVAHLAEAIGLRAALGPRPAIHVLNGIAPGAEGECIAAGVTPVLNSVEQVAAWRPGRAQCRPSPRRDAAGRQRHVAHRHAAGRGRAARGHARHARAHRDRPGDEPSRLRRRAGSSDERDQLAEFLRLKALLPDAPASLANSSGICLGEAFHFDLVRPGAALYGINPTPGRPNPMRQVIRLQAKILQSRELPAGAGVGYGHAFHTGQRLRAATISLGYGDGWPRRAAGAAWHGDVRLPFIGRVSMDSIIVDISAVRGGLAAGEFVELIGPHQSVDDIAALAGTIGYEILTSLGRRFHRIYVDDRTASQERT